MREPDADHADCNLEAGTTMLIEALHTARDLGRTQEIARVLIHYGLGDLVRRFGIARALARAGRALRLNRRAPPVERSAPERMRCALEELGPVFVKLGQVLAGRGDLLPHAWTEELAALQDSVAPAPCAEVLRQLEVDLGALPHEVFSEFEARPLAAGSIAQVHRARLVDGTDVVLKVRRPGIEAVVETDLRLLARLAALAEHEIPDLRRFRPKALLRQFARSLRDELDLRREAQTTARMRRFLQGYAGIVVPRVHDAYSKASLCVMDHVVGDGLRRALHAGLPAGLDRAAMARSGADAVLGMIFEAGLFHADPHAGNVILCPDGRLALLDFGMVGQLTSSRREQLMDLLSAVALGREAPAVEVLLEWSAGDDTDGELLAVDVAGLIQRYRDLPLAQLDASALLTDVCRLLRDHDLVLPADVALLIKVFLTLEALGRQLDPSFRLAAHLEPVARRAIGPRAALRRMRRGWRHGAALAASLPRHIDRLLTQLRSGSLRLEVDLRRLDRLAERLELSANRLAVGMITAALIIGTAIALNAAGGPRIGELSVFALAGFWSSIVAGVWLLLSIWRSTRR